MAVGTDIIAVKDALNVQKSLAVHQDPAGVLSYAVGLDRPGLAAYAFGATFTPQATAAVTLITVTGSATKTVRILGIYVTGRSTAEGSFPYQIIRSTALGSGGTAVAPTAGKLDSGTVAAATAVVNHYTTTLKAAGTSTGIGPVDTGLVVTTTTAVPTIAQSPGLVWPRSPLYPQGIVLRGASDFLEIQNINAGNLAAGTVLTYNIVLVEDDS